MRSYTGTDRIHDRMDREARDEEAYDQWEKKVLGAMRPGDFSEWLWRAQWEFYLCREERYLAMQDAKAMAIEIGESATIKMAYDGKCYFARPVNINYWHLASSKAARFNFKMRLIKEKKFPDISKYAGKDKHFVISHQQEVIKKYQRMAEENFMPKFDNIPF